VTGVASACGDQGLLRQIFALLAGKSHDRRPPVSQEGTGVTGVTGLVSSGGLSPALGGQCGRKPVTRWVSPRADAFFCSRAASNPPPTRSGWGPDWQRVRQFCAVWSLKPPPTRSGGGPDWQRGTTVSRRMEPQTRPPPDLGGAQIGKGVRQFRAVWSLKPAPHPIWVGAQIAKGYDSFAPYGASNPPPPDLGGGPDWQRGMTVSRRTVRKSTGKSAGG